MTCTRNTDSRHNLSISEIVNTHEWVVITMQGCSHCTHLKTCLQGTPFVEIPYDKLKNEVREFLRDNLTFPQLFHNGKHCDNWTNELKLFGLYR
jgi:glutaredoxin